MRCCICHTLLDDHDPKVKHGEEVRHANTRTCIAFIETDYQLALEEAEERISELKEKRDDLLIERKNWIKENSRLRAVLEKILTCRAPHLDRVFTIAKQALKVGNKYEE
jgi:hypothetical protein